MVRLNERVSGFVDNGSRGFAEGAVEALCAEVGDGVTFILLDPSDESLPFAVFAHRSERRRAEVDRLFENLTPEDLVQWLNVRVDGHSRLYGRITEDRPDLAFNAILRKYTEETKHESVVYAPLYHLDGRMRGSLICTRDPGGAPHSDSDLDVIVHAAHTASMLLSVVESRSMERATSRYWESAFETPNVGRMVLDADRYVIRANHACADIGGIEQSELLGMRYPRNVGDEAIAQDFADLELARTGQPVPIRIREIRRPDGETRVVQRSMSAVLTDSGDAEVFHLQFVDITALHDAEAEIAALAEHRRLLLGELVSAEQAERTRIGQDVHDDSIQLLTAAQLRMQLLHDQLGDEDRAKSAADAVSELLGTAQRRLRQLLLELEPPASSTRPLHDSIAHVASIFFEETNTRVTVTGTFEQLPLEVAAVFFRAARECLSNARRHAGASRIEVDLAEDAACWSLTVTDNGVGIPDDLTAVPGHLGLRGMQSRSEALGGSCTVRRRAVGGTEVVVVVPKAPNATQR
jgi:PAS domain S-box-containing protein